MPDMIPPPEKPAANAIRRALIAAAGWAALPVALAALLALTYGAIYAGLLPQFAAPAVMTAVLALAVVLIVKPFSRLRRLSEYVFDRYSITETERSHGLVICAIAVAIAAPPILLVV